MNPLFTSLKLWIDPVPRSGPENMAIDDWLLESAVCSVLRVYEWKGAWGSLGCFCSLKQAMESFDHVDWVRRSTGGGVVDHQKDWTYTLVIPETDPFARISARESYRQVHQVLSSALIDRFNPVLGRYSQPELGGVCFEKPVEFDVVDAVGNKIAGAGQRRTKHGLLHQGSVIGALETSDSIERSKRLAAGLASHWELFEPSLSTEWIERKVTEKYGHPDWTARR
jgi:lipoate-protein ligase A